VRPVQLAYARDRTGKRVSVLDLDPRRRGERAPFTCPGCGDALVPRLGRIRARHFAHPPGSRCPLASPETALHQNAKERLLALCQEAFSGVRRVLLAARCPGCRRPAPLDLAAAGDGASAEAPVGPLRADVLVTRRGAPALALEVRVAHALEAGKEEALARLGVPALEIDARGPWEREEAGAAVVEVSRAVGLARCASCQALSRADAGRLAGGEEAAIAELEAYRARGLLGPRPGPPAPKSRVISRAERRELSRAFACPECGGRALEISHRLARHSCPGGAPREVAWRGYDGALVVLSWWRRG
jgi:transcription elongation factor Elf1